MTKSSLGKCVRWGRPGTRATGTPGTDFALCHQLQGAQAVPGMARQHVHRRDQLAGGVHHDGGLVTVEPTVAALVAVAHLRIMHRHGAVLAHSLFQGHLTVIPITVRAPLSTGSLACACRATGQQPVGVGHNLPQPRLPRLPV